MSALGVVEHLVFGEQRFPSHSQWGQHWPVLLSDNGDSAIVSPPCPTGFDLESEDLERLEGEPRDHVVGETVSWSSSGDSGWQRDHLPVG